MAASRHLHLAMRSQYPPHDNIRNAAPGSTTTVPPAAAVALAVVSLAPPAPADCTKATRLPAATPLRFLMAALDILAGVIDSVEKKKLTVGHN